MKSARGATFSDRPPVADPRHGFSPTVTPSLPLPYGPTEIPADLALVITHADARPVAAGEVEPSVAYMRGRLKATGDGALLIGLLASTATEEYRAWRQAVMDPTDPGPAHH